MILVLLIYHLFLIIKGGYFLSPEFRLYPFLTHSGFLPYKNIIDQHFPALLFGPFSLPYPLSEHPLVIFTFILLLTDILFYLSLIRNKSQFPLLKTFLFISLNYYFQGNFLWLETFISLFIALIVFLNNPLSLGFFYSILLITRPTLLPTALILLKVRRHHISPLLITGFILPLFITALYLNKFGIFSDFQSLVINFNATSYLRLASKLPTIRQFFETGLLFGLLSSPVTLLLALASLVTAYPRFEYLHLQPFILLVTYYSSFSKYRYKLIVLLIIFVTFLNISKIFRHPYGDFYQPKDLLDTANYLKSTDDVAFYNLGGSDLLYPLSAKTPPNFTYLPSLPWYLQSVDFQNKVVKSLESSPFTLVVVNRFAAVDQKNLYNSSGLIKEYIESHYVKVESFGSYVVYHPKL